MKLKNGEVLEFSSSQIDLLTKVRSLEEAGLPTSITSVWFEEASGLWWKCCMYYAPATQNNQEERTVHLTERGRYVAKTARAEKRLSFPSEELVPYSKKRGS